MATVYSLVCFGGLAGKTVTFTDTGDVVNLSYHGLRPGVTGVVFSTTTSLPTGITAGTTYYSRDGTDTGKFTIYPTKDDALAGTNQVTFTGTGSGTHTVKSAYMLGLTTEQKARYGANGSERIYAGLAAWNTGRATAGNYDTEVCEIGEGFIDYTGNGATINAPSYETIIHTEVNGVKSAAHWSYGLDSCYAVQSNASGGGIIIGRARVKIRGVCAKANSNSSAIRWASYALCEVSGCVIYGVTNRIAGSTGINQNGQTTYALLYNNLIFGVATGISVSNYCGLNDFWYNNSVYDCTTGFLLGATLAYGSFFNCVAAGCATNWGVQYAGFQGGSNNAGISTDTPWGASPVTSVDLAASPSQFSSFSANTVEGFRPTSYSPLVNAGTVPYQGVGHDLTDAYRPDYESATFPNNLWDIGALEYNHGEGGTPPLQVTLAISGMVEGSALAVYKTSDGSAIISPTTIGASGSYSTTYTYTGDTQILVEVRKGTGGTKYLAYSAPGLITSTGFSLIVNQVPDGVLNG